ncbi:response regulator transcription factor [Sulfuricaulis sp.]|jgi:FixJ family two-component response regulator|uniref:response regulator transcription factor n=1 Tax=Sulfuricaulis sp. TaxID=2003553 RepID=UPI003559C7C0
MTEVAPMVFVVDDDPSVRKSVGRLLKSAGYQAETFASAREFLRRDEYPGPGCLVLDVQLPELSGLDLQQTLAGTAHSLPIIFISGHGDIPMSVRAMKNGAVDFLPKPFVAQDLLRVIGEALQRSRREQNDRLETATIRKRLARLTPREYEVLCSVVAGKLNKQIAVELGVGEKTVKVHRGRVMEKMDADSVAELVRLSERGGVIPTPIRV